MSRIFISHSSKNNAAAVALNGWLRENGWDDVFLDLDPERGIEAGKRWERALYQAAERCQAVIFLVSRDWLASDWCGKEFDLAAHLSKRMFCVLIDQLAISEIPPRFTDTWQVANLCAGQDHIIFTAVIPPDDREEHVTFSQKGLQRLKAGLRTAGLDPTFFEWPPKNQPDRPPYGGLSPMEEADAGIFFGRGADIVRALDELRRFAQKSSPRIFVIQASSGCGKSSFLRAGLIPRLKRDDRNYLVLPPIRPEQAPINGAHGLVSALTAAFADAGIPRARADLRTLTQSPELLEAALADLAGKKTVPAMPDEAENAPPAIVIPIDQAEELFQSGGREEGRCLLDLLAKLARSRTIRIILLFTIRTDDYSLLQTAAEFEGMWQHAFSLPPVPIGRLSEIIKGPADRMTESGRKLTIEEELVSDLLNDLQRGAGTDVMPLCAFILERLWLEYGTDGNLTLAEYKSEECGIGGIGGAIEAAVEPAFDDPRRKPEIPCDLADRQALLRRAMIPALAVIDPETRTPRRRVAHDSEISREALPLIERLVGARLLKTDRDLVTGERTFETAHEAVLRQWSLMAGWLAEDATLLVVLDEVERATTDWFESGRSDRWLVHADGRLEDAERLLDRAEFAARLDGKPLGYLKACRAVEDARREKELADARRIAEGACLARNNEAAALAALSSIELSTGRTVAATKLALAAWPRTPADDRARRKIALNALASAVCKLRERIRLNGHTDGILSIAFSYDGTRLATGSSDGTARLWDAATGEELASIVVGQFGDVNAAAFSPDGTRLATGLDDNTVRVWDVATGVEIVRLKGHSGPIFSVAFSPDGGCLATSSSADGTRLWGVATGQKIAHFKGESNDVAFSPDGTRLATGAGDSASLWDVTTGARIAHILNIKGHSEQIDAVAFSPDGTRLATGSWDKTARLWDVATGEEIARLEGHSFAVHSVAFSPDGTHLATGSRDGTARLWDVATGKEIARLVEGYSGTVSIFAFSPDGTRLAIGFDDPTPQVWDAATGVEISRLKGQYDLFGSVAFSPDGSPLTIGCDNNMVRLWDMATGEEVARFEGHSADVASVAFSPDGARLATGSWDQTARLWDVATTKEIARLEGHSAGVESVAFSPDGARLATGSRDETARLWDVATGAEIARLDGHAGYVSSVSFSPDGTRLATGFSDGAALWDVATGEKIVRLEGSAWVRSLVFSPDGARLATNSGCCTAQLWDVATGGEIARLGGDSGFITTGIAFSPDGTRLATISNDDTVRLWRITFLPYDDRLRVGVPPGDLFRIACTWLPWVEGHQDHLLTELAAAYGIEIDTPICNYGSGYDPPLPR